MIKVVRTFDFPGALEIEKEVFGDGFEIIEAPSSTEDELIENCRDADAVICEYEPFTRRVIDALPKLKLIAFGTIGFNYADVDHAKSKGIAVSHISKYCIREVADYTVGMMLNLNHRISAFHSLVKEDRQWAFDAFPGMRRFDTLTIGLLGFGNIPRLVAKRLKPFGVRLIAYDPFVDVAEVKAEYDTDMKSFEAVLAEADILSLHLPVTKDTGQIINSRNIAKMKDGVMLINSARGQLVDEAAITGGVESGKIQYYAADVLSEEDPDLSTHPFMDHDNIILTPHIAFYSEEAVREASFESAMNVKYFFDGNYKGAQIVNGVHV
ncbi:C-terminal binding protein [Lacicoccus alkaliphilus]|uniref:D-3-phosphoglycerate dehydrogenase n=1 Tax=Lacicoccus alkaliphilus DSM 16010 TaxID=1123231 RepID=A0A1M7JJ50_9BACL|nr:C-terminal binding protein [Salinicoccus alkaliphilus]SHM53110.1 D-3-phosphoglycerate dehydrogenase [Salinicoccus alkaliphilus DSM 16010]